jgi:hypothetical protein
MSEKATAADVVLVTCVKSKRSRPAAAKDLYTSALFRKERAYAERVGVPWFILSAEHGLVAPDEWLSPYDRYLINTPATYRSAWGGWVVARLELLAGPIKGKVVEIHAGALYVEAVRPALESLGARIIDPLCGLKMGPRLAWYGGSNELRADELEDIDEPPTAELDDIESCVRALLDTSAGLSPQEFTTKGRMAFDRPGLYSWCVDQEGADDLGRGLGLAVEKGLIYAGLAGATRWPSGKRSNNTLWLRVMTMHLGGNHDFSTFRLTLGSILAYRNGMQRIDEEALTRWMHQHLRIVSIPFDDRDTLGRLERDVLVELDPPLNLQGMHATPLRHRLKELRRSIRKLDP